MEELTPRERVNTNRQGDRKPNRQSTQFYKDYREIDPHDFLDQAYHGTGGFSGKTGAGQYCFIISNPTENFYATRCQMSIYLNMVKKMVDVMWKPIFRDNIKTYIETDAGSTIEHHLYLDFVENVTGSGLGLADFCKNALRESIIHDVSYVCMDMLEGDTQPFIYLKSATSLLEYETDEKGGLISVTFDEGVETSGSGKIFYRRYIGLDAWRLLVSDDGKEFRVAKEVINNLGILPVYPMFSNGQAVSGDYRPWPSLYSVGAYSAYLYDKNSKLDYVIDKQAHSIKVFQGLTDASLSNGIDNCIILPPDESIRIAPSILSPDSGLIQVHSDRIDRALGYLYDIMEDNGVSVQRGNLQAESGVAKAYTFNATNTVLLEKVNVLKSFTKWLYQTYKIFTNDTGTWLSYTEFPVNFTPRASLSVDEMIRLIDMYNMENLPKNKADLLLRLRSVIDPNASREEEEDFLTEIKTTVRTPD